ncbi:MAG TPA: alanine dehydrogenase [Chromatiales bacterium]|nr:alanine dehydrogenase [Chromatiales bacterium]
MEIGVPKEIKDHENRVALTPEAAGQLIEEGHRVWVQAGAGHGSGFTDDAYQEAGARLCDATEAWSRRLVVKVKEPLPQEYPYLQGQILFTFLHLAGVDPGLTRRLLETATTAIGYETVEDRCGRLPLLAPMSAIAGNMATLMGAYHLAATQGGRGVQPGKVLGTPHGRVLVIGDGTVGRHAARVAIALGASVAMAGRKPARAEALRREMPGELEWFCSTPQSLARRVRESDLVVSAVLVRGARAPHVVTEDMVRSMPRGSVIVDVSIDQGGSVETARPTTHSHPTFVRHGVIHYCVTNMPGAYPRTATLALVRATLPYLRALAGAGLAALRRDAGFARGLQTHKGHVTCEAVARALGLMDRYRPAEEILAADTP